MYRKRLKKEISKSKKERGWYLGLSPIIFSSCGRLMTTMSEDAQNPKENPIMKGAHYGKCCEKEKAGRYKTWKMIGGLRMFSVGPHTSKGIREGQEDAGIRRSMSRWERIKKRILLPQILVLSSFLQASPLIYTIYWYLYSCHFCHNKLIVLFLCCFGKSRNVHPRYGSIPTWIWKVEKRLHEPYDSKCT